MLKQSTSAKIIELINELQSRAIEQHSEATSPAEKAKVRGRYTDNGRNYSKRVFALLGMTQKAIKSLESGVIPDSFNVNSYLANLRDARKLVNALGQKHAFIDHQIEHFFSAKMMAEIRTLNGFEAFEKPSAKLTAEELTELVKGLIKAADMRPELKQKLAAFRYLCPVAHELMRPVPSVIKEAKKAGEVESRQRRKEEATMFSTEKVTTLFADVLARGVKAGSELHCEFALALQFFSGRRISEVLVTADFMPSEKAGFVVFSGQTKEKGKEDGGQPYEIPVLCDTGVFLKAFKAFRNAQKGITFPATYGQKYDGETVEEPMLQDWRKVSGHLERVNLALNGKINAALWKLTGERSATSHILRKIYAAIVIEKKLLGDGITASRVRSLILGHSQNDDGTQASYDTVISAPELEQPIKCGFIRAKHQRVIKLDTEPKATKKAEKAAKTLAGISDAVLAASVRAKSLPAIHAAAVELVTKGVPTEDVLTPSFIVRHIRPEGKAINYNTIKKYLELVAELMAKD